MKCCTITVRASASAARPPAIYTAQIMQSSCSHSYPDWDDARRVSGGVGRVPFPGAGSVSKFASSPSLRESLGFHSCRRVLGETAGLQTHLAHTGTHDCLFKQNNKGTTAPEARRAGLPADRKELINRVLMTPAPSPVGSVLRAPVIEKYGRGRIGVR